MLRSKEMTMVRIVGTNKRLSNVIETLYDLKILHLVDFKKSEQDFFDMGKPFTDADLYSKQLLSLRSMISYFNASGEPKSLKSFKDSKRKFEKIEKQFRSSTARLTKLKSEETNLTEKLSNPLLKLNLRNRQMEGYKYLHAFLGTVKRKFDDKLSEITTDYELRQVEAENEIVIALFVPVKHKDKVQSLLAEVGFTEYSLPDFNVDKTKSRLTVIEKEIKTVQHSLDSTKIQAQFLVDYEFLLTQLNEKAEAPIRFASSKNTFVATGWVPTDKAEEMKSILDKQTASKISVELMQGENPPVALDNVKPSKPFEFLISLYSLPKYYEIDPTILMFLTFPLFFGFMLGDVGYGIVTLIPSLLLMRKVSQGVKPLISIIVISSIATIIFGFIYGEFFGYDFIHPLLNRVENVNGLLTITIVVGAIHITSGFILGFVNEYGKHGLSGAIFKKGSWLVLELGAGLLVASYLLHNPSFQLSGGIVLGASILMLIKGDGFLSLMELPTLLTNILSYTRLYAFGLASVALASIINNMSFGLISQGGFAILGAIGLLAFGHLVNLILGVLGSFLQSMRLHYVEFFQKFYEGGGYYYSPFGVVKKQ